MRDNLDRVTARVAIAPVVVADNTAQVSNIIDTQGYEALSFIFALGTIADVDTTVAVTIQHGDQSNLSDAATPASYELVGTAALAGFQFDSDNLTRKIGYIGAKRYVRLTATPSNNTGNMPMSAIALLSVASIQPTSNP
jgi:hypothetical protein